MVERERAKILRRLERANKRSEEQIRRARIKDEKRFERQVKRLMERVIDKERGLSCKYCGSRNLVKYGQCQGVQRYFCKDCKRKFAYNKALPHMSTPVIQVASALSMYYGGMSLNSIRRHLEQQYRNYPSDSTVYRWIVRFTKIAVEEAKKYKPEVGDVWVADETVLRIGGKKIDRLKKGVWFWDILDTKTRFLLASHISQARTADDAEALMDKAWRRAGKSPRIILTDKLGAYLDGVSIVFGRKTTKHIQVKGFTARLNANLIERFHGTLKDRTKVMRGFKSIKTARLLLDGWLIHYNFFRPHEYLGDKTPAEKAGIKFTYKDWLDVVKRGGISVASGDITVSTIGKYHKSPPKAVKYKAKKKVVKAKLARRKVTPAIGTIRC